MENGHETMRRALMDLWKDIFGDSEEYVSLVFDTYYRSSIVETFIDKNGRPVASLTGVPYEVRLPLRMRSPFMPDDASCNKGQAATRIGAHAPELNRYPAREGKTDIPVRHGIYLCGLSTVPSMRRMGLMTRLIRECERRATEKGYSCCFLIPAGKDLVEYYGRLGYRLSYGGIDAEFEFYETSHPPVVESCGRGCVKKLSESICRKLDGDVIVNNLGSDKLSVSELKIDRTEFEEILKIYGHHVAASNESDQKSCAAQRKFQLLKRSHSLLRAIESEEGYTGVVHSLKDFIAACRECIVSGGRVLVMQKDECEPIALSFCYTFKEKGETKADMRYFSLGGSEECPAMMLLYLNSLCGGRLKRLSLHLPLSSRSISVLSRFRELEKGIGADTFAAASGEWGGTKLLRSLCAPRLRSHGMIKQLVNSRDSEIADHYTASSLKHESRGEEENGMLFVCKDDLHNCRPKEKNTTDEVAKWNGNGILNGFGNCNDLQTEILKPGRKHENAPVYPSASFINPDRDDTEGYFNLSLMLD